MEGPLSMFRDHSTGEAICSQNVMTAASIANIVKSSLESVGLDKMFVDDIGDMTITNDPTSKSALCCPGYEVIHWNTVDLQRPYPLRKVTPSCRSYQQTALPQFMNPFFSC